MFDVTRRESFNNINKWYQEVKQHSAENIVLLLVGNKVDLEDKRVITKIQAETFAHANGMVYVESSAKHGTNVQDVFMKTAASILEKVMTFCLFLNFLHDK